jgi:acyl-CoA reductase-like NAD-dependent aldehyde dehydrogenase
VLSAAQRNPISFGDGRVTKVQTGADSIEAALARASEALAEVRALRSTDAIARTLTAAAARWCTPDYAPRQRAVRDLAASNRVAPAMLESALDFIFGAITSAEIAELLRREGGDLGTLEPTVDADGKRRCGPRLVYFANAGNLPGQAIPVLVFAALARTAIVVRESARQPGITTAFVESIRETDARLADTFVVIEGLRGEENEAAVRDAAHIEVSGSDDTVAALSSRYRTVTGGEIVEHGTRTSAAVIAEAAEIERAAQGTAQDAAIYEGRGCLTPHVVYVEGGAARAQRFAEELAAALAGFEARWPRCRQTLEEEAARREFIDAAELAALAEADCGILQGAAGAWCVAVGPAQSARPDPGHRCLRVVATVGRRATLKCLMDSRAPLAGIAVAGEAIGEAADSLRDAGATLVCETGELAGPPLYWQQDGRPRLAGLLAAGDSKTR